ncbi:MAG: type II secretion system minor pseudopilin GspJ [Gammaproteobacteria bacterium]|jgi:general secretion pathway protein J
MRRLRCKNARGFTLLELLISIVIFGLIAAMAYSALNNMMIARSQTEARTQQLYKLQMALTLMERDIEQIVDRPARDEFRQEQPAFMANERGEFLLEFTRTGWPNPAKLPRSHLQRVRYSLDEEKLIRSLWYVLDRAPDSERYDIVLMDGVKSLEFSFLDDEKKPQRSWPPERSNVGQILIPGQEPPPAAPAPPRGILMEMDTKSFGKLERWFHLPG